MRAKTARCFLLAALSLGLFISIDGRQSVARQPDDFTLAYQKFKAGYEDELRRQGIVGSSFYFIRDNQVVAKDFYGMADSEQNRKVDEETIYHWASITKTFTGIAIMQLRDRGLLSLDD